MSLKGKDLVVIDGFSVRQSQLVTLLAQGKSNKEIADELKISYGTVKQHLVVLFKKLSVSNRYKAALIAQRLVKDASGYGAQRATVSESSEHQHQWRMISAVAFVMPESTDNTPKQVINRRRALATIHTHLTPLVESLDGCSMVTPCGGLLAWFGFPNAHSDDTDRAISLVYAAQKLIHGFGAMAPDLKSLGSGVANMTEMVGDLVTTLYGLEVFGQAMELARFSAQVRLPLVSQLSRRLCHLPIRQVGLKPVDSNSSSLLKDAIGISDETVKNYTVQSQWGELPFMNSLCGGVANGLAQWVSVSSWPISSTAFLLAAMEMSVKEANFRIIHIRLPARRSRNILMESLFNQIDFQIDPQPKTEFDGRAGADERLAGLIRSLCEVCPVCLIVHGQDGLQVLRSALTNRGVEMLVGQRLMIIGQLNADRRHEAVVQTLGPRASGHPFTRSYVLKVPDSDETMTHLSLELSALLDSVSPLAREMAIEAAHSSDGQLILDHDDNQVPIYRTQEALQELQAVGLVVPAQGHGFVFRDPIFAQVIKELDVIVGNEAF